MNAQEQVFCHYVDPPILNLDTVLVYQNVVQYIKNVHAHSEWRKSERITSLSLTSILTKGWNILHNFQNLNTTHHTLAEILND